MGTETITIDTEKLAEFKAVIPRVVAQAQGFDVVTAEDYEASLPLLESIGQRVRQIQEFFAPTKKQASDLHKSIIAQEKAMVDPYIAAEFVLKGKRLEWRAEQKRIDDERKAAEEAEARRVRQLEIQAEQKRLAEEAAERERVRKAQEEELKRKAAEMKAAGEREAARVLKEQAANIAQQNEAEKVADAELAKTSIEALANAPLPVVERAATPTPGGGAGVRKKWKAVILNPKLIPQHLLLPKDALDAEQPHYRKVRDIVEALGQDHGIPGVGAVEKETEAVRRK